LVGSRRGGGRRVMNISVWPDPTHILVTFEAMTAVEGYQLGQVAEKLRGYGIDVGEIPSILQIAYPKPIAEAAKEESDATKIEQLKSTLDTVKHQRTFLARELASRTSRGVPDWLMDSIPGGLEVAEAKEKNDA